MLVMSELARVGSPRSAAAEGEIEKAKVEEAAMCAKVALPPVEMEDSALEEAEIEGPIVAEERTSEAWGVLEAEDPTLEAEIDFASAAEGSSDTIAAAEAVCWLGTVEKEL